MVQVWNSGENTFKYHVSCTDGNISVRINLLFYLYFPPSSHPTFVCFFPVGLSSLIQHYQQVLWVLKLLLSPGLGSWQLEFKSLIIVIVGFQNWTNMLNLLDKIRIHEATSVGTQQCEYRQELVAMAECGWKSRLL